MLIDARSAQQRAEESEIPCATVIDRNMLEWRLDHESPRRLAAAADHSVRVTVIYNEGYSSSLVAVTLQDLGLFNATDVIGGFQAWRAAGLPTSRS
ncbi:MAG: rhodanese-like domain-containing protein [Candidatus Dormibacteraceae bacterium]